jgi:hypothetical protein
MPQAHRFGDRFSLQRPVSVRDATYLVGSDTAICCTPTVPAFEQQSDTERFHRGFNGRLMLFEEADLVDCRCRSKRAAR